MNPQHLSDEAVAAFADGVLRGHARDRAARHVEGCLECRTAVRSQREAALALRAAAAPCLPSGLFERLRAVPVTTPIAAPPTVVADDGTTMFATFAPMAALAPSHLGSAAPLTPRAPLRANPFVTGSAVVALAASAFIAGAVAQHDDNGPATTVRQVNSTTVRGGAADSPRAGVVQPEFVGARFIRR